MGKKLQLWFKNVVTLVERKLRKTTIKRAIFLSNTIMVLISLLIMLGIGGILVSLFKDKFLKSISENSMISDNTFEIKEMLSNMQDFQGDWDSFDKELKNYDFRLLVRNDEGKKEYSSIKHSEIEGVKGLFSTPADLNEVHVYYLENITVVQTKVQYNNKEFNIYAADCSKSDYFLGMDRGMFEIFIIIFILVGILSIIVILFFSQIFTRLLIKRILTPVEKLNMAAKRIDTGDLSKCINYEREDEFKKVCDSFDTMQTHLREGLEKNASYEKARTEMVSGISHDLRTPLTSIKGFVKGMIDGVANTEEKRNKYLEIVYRKSCDMEILLNKLFYFSKLETGRMPFFKSKVNIEKYIKKYVDNKVKEIDNEAIAIKAEGNLSKYNCVLIDKEQIKRVFDNIIENSIKYSEAEKLKIEIKLRNIESKDGKEKIELIIADNGDGMDEDKIPHIFEQFYRGDESRNSKCDGNGLGMYVCQYIIKEHGGNIHAYNHKGLNICIELNAEEEGDK